MYDTSFIQTAFAEQETQINISYADKQASVYTSRPAVAKTLADLAAAHPDETRVIRCDTGGFEIEVPVSWIVVRPKIKHNITEEQRQARAERLAAARQKRKEAEG